MTDIQQGRCYICYASGLAGRKTNFICGDCADPEHIVVCCACGDRQVFDPGDADIIAAHFEESTELKAGSILKIPHCAKCLNGKQPTGPFRIEHYQIT